MSSEHGPSQKISQGDLPEIVVNAIDRLKRQGKPSISLPENEEGWKIVIERINAQLAPKTNRNSQEANPPKGENDPSSE